MTAGTSDVSTPQHDTRRAGRQKSPLLRYHPDDDIYEARCGMRGDCPSTEQFTKGFLNETSALHFLNKAYGWRVFRLDTDQGRKQILACGDCARRHARAISDARLNDWLKRKALEQRVLSQFGKAPSL